MTIPTEVDRRFRDAAAAEGLVDAAYDVVDSPIGPLLVGATSRGLCRISFDAAAEPNSELERLADLFGPRVLRVPRATRCGTAPARRLLRGPEASLRARGRPHGRAGLSAGSIAGAGSCPIRGDLHVRRACGPDRAAEGGARCRGRLEPQPGAHRAPLPPHRGSFREPGRLRRRARAKAGAPRPGGRGSLLALRAQVPVASSRFRS